MATIKADPQRRVEKRTATGMLDVTLGYNASGEPPMGRQEADELAAWVTDGIQNRYIEDVTLRKPIAWQVLPFQVKATVRRKP